MDNMLRKKYMGVRKMTVQANNSQNNGIARESAGTKVRKTTNKPSLCCHPKLEKPSKGTSATEVEFGFGIEGG